MVYTWVEIRRAPIGLLIYFKIAVYILKSKTKTNVGLIGSTTPCRCLSKELFTAKKNKNNSQVPDFIHLTPVYIEQIPNANGLHLVCIKPTLFISLVKLSPSGKAATDSGK